MADVSERVRAMDDFQVVRFFEAFSQQLLADSTASLDGIKRGVPESARRIAGWDRVEGVTAEQAEMTIEPADAAALARALLLQLARDPSLGPAMERFLASYRDEELVADVILAVGLMASMILVTATTEFKGQIAGVTFTKGKVDPATLRALVEPFADVLKGLLKH